MDHHFIPQYYLVGFYGPSRKLYQYNKVTGRVDKAGKTAAQVCYEIDLHALKLDNIKDYFIETYLSLLEGQCKIFLRTLGQEEDGLKSIHLIPDACNILKLMLYLQFWRLPSSTMLAKNASECLLALYSERVNRSPLPLPDEVLMRSIYENRENPNVLKVIQFCVLPVLTCHFDGSLPKGVKVEKLLDGEPDLLCSDRPVCYEDVDDDFEFQGELFFPLTKRIVLARNHSDRPVDVDKVQRAIVSRAKERYFGSSLELVEVYKSCI